MDPTINFDSSFPYISRFVSSRQNATSTGILKQEEIKEKLEFSIFQWIKPRTVYLFINRTERILQELNHNKITCGDDVIEINTLSDIKCRHIVS